MQALHLIPNIRQLPGSHPIYPNIQIHTPTPHTPYILTLYPHYNHSVHTSIRFKSSIGVCMCVRALGVWVRVRVLGGHGRWIEGVYWGFIVSIMFTGYLWHDVIFVFVRFWECLASLRYPTLQNVKQIEEMQTPDIHCYFWTKNELIFKE